MEQKGGTSSQRLQITCPVVDIVGYSPLVRVSTGLLVLCLLAAGLYLIPIYAAYGLAVFGLGVPLLLLLWRRPEFGLLVVVFLATSLIRADVVDLRLPIGGGLELRDLVLISMMGLLILKGLIGHNFAIPWWPVSAPLITFLSFALFSTVFALFYHRVTLNWTLSEFRAVIFYCVFFVTAWAVTDNHQLTIVLVGLFILSDLVAGAIILQQFLGANNPLLTAMSYSNWQLFELQQAGGTTSFGMVRIMPPGVVLVYFTLVLAFCLMVFIGRRQLRGFFVLQFVFLGLGLLLTYTRALWIAAAVALGLALVSLFPVYRAQLMRYLVIGAALLALAVCLLGIRPRQSMNHPSLVTTFFDRFVSILRPEETLESYSLQWRVFETEQGLRAILANPLVGVGLGNSYREITTFQGEALGWMTNGRLASGEISRFTRFLHNSYLYIAVKMGLPALVCFLWFCVALIANCVRLYRRRTQPLARAIALAVLTGITGLMVWSVFHQHFLQTESIAIIGLMAGLSAILHRDVDAQESLLQEPLQWGAARRHA